MRLFHVSENPDITHFDPIVPSRQDLDQSIGLIWALCERTLPNFLVPRDCPRVTYHVHKGTTPEDIDAYLSSPSSRHCVAIEHRWVPRLGSTTLTLYEFDPTNFVLQDEAAGYYVSTKTEYPIARHTITNLFQALEEHDIEVRILPEILSLRDRIIHTSFHWSMCRMKHAIALDDPVNVHHG
jgi:hypothetical protein